MTASLAVVLGLLGSPLTGSDVETAGAVEVAAAERPPNVVIILSDDQRVRTISRMPQLWSQIRRKGVTYSRAAAPTSLCCPARATLLTGLYAHSTRVYSNGMPYGGWQTFSDQGMEQRTVATALDAAGYHTALVGKYLNGYPSQAAQGFKPPGWDEFVTFTTQYGKYNYGLSDGVYYGDRPEDYQADVLARHAVDIVRKAPADEPLFLYYAPTSPHRPYVPAPRHIGAWKGRIPSYHPPSVTENVSDKPPWVRQYRRRPQERIDADAVGMQEMLMAVDDAVGNLVGALEETGRMDNTLFIYLSDNGMMMGEHHLFEWKNVPYRWSTDIPMVVRWDGHIAPNTTDRRMALNVDVAATISAATGAPMQTEGFDLLGTQRRSGYPLEATKRFSFDSLPNHPAYCGYRTSRYMFVQYDGGFRELYDYKLDPHELTNVAYDPKRRERVKFLRSRARATCKPTPPEFSW